LPKKGVHEVGTGVVELLWMRVRLVGVELEHGQVDGLNKDSMQHIEAKG
jgi:uncharacterized membrane protein YqjE